MYIFYILKIGIFVSLVFSLVAFTIHVFVANEK
jgi:hypothetical protein